MPSLDGKVGLAAASPSSASTSIRFVAAAFCAVGRSPATPAAAAIGGSDSPGARLPLREQIGRIWPPLLATSLAASLTPFSFSSKEDPDGVRNNFSKIQHGRLKAVELGIMGIDRVLKKRPKKTRTQNNVN